MNERSKTKFQDTSTQVVLKCSFEKSYWTVCLSKKFVVRVRETFCSNQLQCSSPNMQMLRKPPQASVSQTAIKRRSCRHRRCSAAEKAEAERLPTDDTGVARARRARDSQATPHGRHWGSTCKVSTSQLAARNSQEVHGTRHKLHGEEVARCERCERCKRCEQRERPQPEAQHGGEASVLTPILRLYIRRHAHAPTNINEQQDSISPYICLGVQLLVLTPHRPLNNEGKHKVESSFLLAPINHGEVHHGSAVPKTHEE